MSEPELRDLVTSHGFEISNMSYALTDSGKYFEYDLVIKTRKWENTHRLCQTLANHNLVIEFRIFPTGD
jgi:putative Mg2+ transporter-C (MgtC) family protein